MSRRTAIEGLKTSFRFVLLEQHQGAQRSRGCLSPRSKYYVLSPLIAVRLDVAQGVCSESELLVCQYVRSAPGALNACRRNLPKKMPRQEPGAARTILKEDWQTWKKLKPLQSWPTSICIWLPAATFKKIPGSKQALWMPTPIFKNTGFKAGALNAQLPFSRRYWVQSGRFECPTPMYGISCKESESTLVPRNQNLKRLWQRGIWQQHTGCPTKGLKRVWNGFKIECPVPIYSTMSQKTWKQSGRRSREQPGSTQKERFKWNWNDFITPSRDPK